MLAALRASADGGRARRFVHALRVAARFDINKQTTVILTDFAAQFAARATTVELRRLRDEGFGIGFSMLVDGGQWDAVCGYISIFQCLTAERKGALHPDIRRCSTRQECQSVVAHRVHSLRLRASATACIFLWP